MANAGQAAQDAFADGVQKLAAVLKQAGSELGDAFADFSLSNELDDDMRAVAEVLVAWREVGESASTFAEQLLELGSTLRAGIQKVETQVAQRESEGRKLQDSLAVAESGPPNKQRGFLGGLFGGSDTVDDESHKAWQQQLEMQRATTKVCLDQIANELQSLQQRRSSALVDAVGEVRRYAKAVGEKIAVLRPSWKGSKLRSAKSGIVTSPIKPESGASKNRIAGLIKSLSSVEGREEHQQSSVANVVQSEEQRLGFTKIEDIFTTPPVKSLGTDSWRISGVYEHQVLKAGLRQLDDSWSIDGLLQLPRAKDGGSILMRERLFSDLLEGTIMLKSVPRNDVGAAQRDVSRLTLRQLLRLRVLHLEFTPSGCGADTISGVGATHEAFMATLDGLLFQRLGEKAIGQLAANNADLRDAIHRLGREAVILVAAAAAVPDPVWWSWWLTDARRVFFNAAEFQCDSCFPETGSGVLEVNDLSKPDINDPTGHLRWFDWRVNVVKAKSSLSATSQKGSTPGLVNSAPIAAGKNDPTGKSVPASAAVAASAGPGAALSSDLLKNMRGSLRKVSRDVDTSDVKEGTSNDT